MVEESNVIYERVNMTMIERLEKVGCKVRVRHLREKQFEFEIPRNVNKGLAATLVNVEYAPRGGQTTVSIFTREGLHVLGESNCSHKDIFCRETGRKLALTRALKKLLELKADDYHEIHDEIDTVYDELTA